MLSKKKRETDGSGDKTCPSYTEALDNNCSKLVKTLQFECNRFLKNNKEPVAGSPACNDGLVVANLIDDALKTRRSKRQRACKLMTAYNLNSALFSHILSGYAVGERE